MVFIYLLFDCLFISRSGCDLECHYNILGGPEACFFFTFTTEFLVKS